MTLTYIREARNERSHRNFPSSHGGFADGRESREEEIRGERSSLRDFSRARARVEDIRRGFMTNMESPAEGFADNIARNFAGRAERLPRLYLKL